MKKINLLQWLSLTAALGSMVGLGIILWPHLAEPEKLQAWLTSWGWLSGVSFVLIQVVQVVLFWIPGEVIQVAGGTVFGWFWGTVLSVAGVSLGGQLAFLLARFLGKKWVEKMVESHNLHRLGQLMKSRNLSQLLFLLFLIPFLPKDVLCYLAGMTTLGAWRFFWVTSLARIPSLTLSSLMGAMMLGHWDGFWWVLATVVVAGLITLFLFRHSIMAWLYQFGKQDGQRRNFKAVRRLARRKHLSLLKKIKVLQTPAVELDPPGLRRIG